MSRSDAGTYLYVKDGAQPRDAAALPERRVLGFDPPRPDEPAARVRLVRPIMHAQRCDPLLSMVHCPDSPLGDAVRAIADQLVELEGPIVVTGTANAPVGRMALELAAALVETGGFAAVIDAGADLARTVGVDRFDGLMSQSEQRARDPLRPLELLYVTWRCGLLPLEFDRAAEPAAVTAALAALDGNCDRRFVAAPTTAQPRCRDFAALGHVVLVATPEALADGQLATAISAVAGHAMVGVVVAPSTATA